MKNILLLALLAFSVASCSKSSGLTVDEYIAENNLTTVELDEGVHIIIHEPGDANRPSLSSKIVVNYKGTLTDGEEFDSRDNIEFVLGNLIRGWQIGLQEIGIGGSCTLIIPPGAGYGSSRQGDIPANSTLIFEMDLVDIIF